jgi:AraC-like DNA-binding protein
MKIDMEFDSDRISDLEGYFSEIYSNIEVRKLGQYEKFGLTGTASLFGSVKLEKSTAVGSYEIRPLAPMDVTTFVVVLDSKVCVNSKKSDLWLGRKMATVYHHPVALQLLDGAQQLSLMVPDNLLQRRLTHLLDGQVGRPLQFDSSAFPVDVLGAFTAALQNLPGSPILQLAESVPGQSNGLEDLIIDSLLLNVPNNNSELLSKTPQISPRHVKRALEFIHAAPQRHISPVTLAEVSGVSTRALQYAFRKATGRTITEYQTALRIEMASVELMKSTHRTVGEIGRSLGFISSSNFSQVFKKIIGASPTDFRHNQLNASKNLDASKKW